MAGKGIYSQWNKIKRVFNLVHFSFSFLVEKWDHRSRKGIESIGKKLYY